MIRKSGHRFSDKIMRKTTTWSAMTFDIALQVATESSPVASWRKAAANSARV